MVVTLHELGDWRAVIFEGVSYLSTFSCCTKKGDHCTLIGDCVRSCADPEYARRFPQFKPKALIRNEVARPLVRLVY
jgi:hypothetical protein